MAVSKFLLDLSKRIEQRSGTRHDVAQKSAVPTPEWIPENQLSKMEVIPLRTAEETQNENKDMKLKEFNPASLCQKDPLQNHCRVPGCFTTPRRVATDKSKRIKQDLFMCKPHRTKLIELVSNQCDKAGVTVVSLKSEDFNGYTNLIGLLEKAFAHLKSSFNPTDSALAEVFLNTRNFLLITNALLNPDEDNTSATLCGFSQILKKFLENPTEFSNLLQVMKDVMKEIFGYFGILYEWVCNINPGGRIGAGVGLIGGVFSVARFALSWPIGLAATAVGLVGGYLVGGGTYDWWKDSHHMSLQKEMMQDYQKRMFKYLKQQQQREHKLTMRFCVVFAQSNGNIVIKMAQAEF